MSLASSLVFFRKSSASRVPPIPEDALDAAQRLNEENRSILIIGAGVSGLLASNVLKKVGVKNFTVLEASDSIGGRIRRVDGFAGLPVPLSMGAEWIHFPDPQIVQDLLVFDDVNVLEKEDFIPFSPKKVFLGGTWYNWLHHLYSETKFKSISWHVWLEKYIYSHVKDNVLFNKPVTEIDYTGPKVKVKTKDGAIYTADRVICTIPCAILKKGEMVRFSPPLPDFKKEALAKVDMPPSVRLYFEMKEKFYPTVASPNSLFASLYDDNDLCVIWDPLDNKEVLTKNGNHVLGFVAVGHKNSGALSALKTEKELVEAVLDILDGIFNGQARKNYIQHVAIDWTKQPHIQGSYTFPTNKKLANDLAATIGEGKVLFAGEHTDTMFPTYVPGAGRQGRRAAVEAVLSLDDTKTFVPDYMTKKDGKPCWRLW